MKSNELTKSSSEKHIERTRGSKGFTRRRFIKVAGAFTILSSGCFTLIKDALASFREAGFWSHETLKTLTKSMFDKYKNTPFWLRTENWDFVEMKIINTTGDDVQFTVLLRSNQAEAFPQGTYWVEHDVLGEFDLFLVPFGVKKKGVYYVASFNHMIPVAE
jgi:hypothetical protein